MEARIRGKSWVEAEGEIGSSGLPGIALPWSGCTLLHPGLLALPSSLQCYGGPCSKLLGGPQTHKGEDQPCELPHCC